MVKTLKIKKIKPIYDYAEMYFFKFYLFRRKFKVGTLIFNEDTKQYGIMYHNRFMQQVIVYESDLEYIFKKIQNLNKLTKNGL